MTPSAARDENYMNAWRNHVREASASLSPRFATSGGTARKRPRRDERDDDDDDDDDEVLKERRSPRERGRMGTSHDVGRGAGR
jgi:hypothetical protein